MKKKEAAEAVRLVREALFGASQLKELDEVSKVAMTLAISRSIPILDYYLTGSLDQRQPGIDLIEVARLVARRPTAHFLLSDGNTSLVVRWPTEEDKRCIHLEKLVTETPKTRRRWAALRQMPEAQAESFRQNPGG